MNKDLKAVRANARKLASYRDGCLRAPCIHFPKEFFLERCDHRPGDLADLT